MSVGDRIGLGIVLAVLVGTVTALVIWPKVTSLVLGICAAGVGLHLPAQGGPR